MLTTLLGYFIVLQFFFLDRSRRGQEARSFKAGEADRKSTLYIGIAYLISTLALLAAWIFNWLKVGVLPAWVGWLGVVLAMFGLFFRWWANRVLGEFYTRTLKVTENQSIIRAGPYRLIRHPGYLGSISIWTGAAGGTANWIVLLIVLVTMLVVYIYRIESEEKMLLGAYSDYADYRKHTWRLIPFVY